MSVRDANCPIQLCDHRRVVCYCTKSDTFVILKSIQRFKINENLPKAIWNDRKVKLTEFVDIVEISKDLLTFYCMSISLCEIFISSGVRVSHC